MLISKAFYRHLPIFLNLFKCPLRGLIWLEYRHNTFLLGEYRHNTFLLVEYQHNTFLLLKYWHNTILLVEYQYNTFCW
jgi:hypothetical protein